jgi:hypothetical protein
MRPVESVLLIIDPVAARVLWQAVVPAAPVSLLGGTRFLTYREDSMGRPILTVWETSD